MLTRMFSGAASLGYPVTMGDGVSFIPAVAVVDAMGVAVGGPSNTTPVTGIFTTNGASPAFSPLPGRAIWATLTGTFGGDTVTVQRSVDGGTTWVPLSAGGLPFGVFTGAAQEPIASEDDTGTLYRLSLTGASGTTNIAYRLAHS